MGWDMLISSQDITISAIRKDAPTSLSVSKKGLDEREDVLSMIGSPELASSEEGTVA
jgi:hypothetical protein